MDMSTKIKTTYTLKSGKGILAVEYKQINSEAPTLIFLHESLGCITLWRDFPELLSTRTQCNYFVYDRWGYGESSPNTGMMEKGNDYLEKSAIILIEIIKAFPIQKPILIGHSDGGSIALIAAAKAPSIIKGIISIAGHVFVEDITLKGIRAVEEAYKNTDFSQKLSKYHGEKTNDVFYSWTNIWLSDKFRTWNIVDLIPKINCPSLIIQGADDEYGTLKQVTEISNHISGYAETLILKNTKHVPHKEQKEKVLAAIAQFILQCNTGSVT